MFTLVGLVITFAFFGWVVGLIASLLDLLHRLATSVAGLFHVTHPTQESEL